MPRFCADAFARIERSLGSMSGTVDAIHEHTEKTNGHVSELFDRSEQQATRLTVLEEERRGRTRWTGRAWKLILMVTGGALLLVAAFLFGANG